jgi:hypothetical protein
VAVAGRNSDDDKEGPWHNRTPEVIGASLIAIVVIGILIAAATAIARQFGEPEQAPLDYIAPTYSATNSQTVTTGTTTQTITSTSPPETTDINPSGSSSSSSSSSTTSSSSESSTEPTTARTEEEDEPTTRTTRQRPRTNVTRTFNPFP